MRALAPLAGLLLATLPPLRSALPTDPCAPAPQAECGTSSNFCSFACAWDAGLGRCVSADNYPPVATDSLAKLGAAGTPLSADFLTLSFYGDEITADGSFEDEIVATIAGSPRCGNVRVLNQGVRGATLADLVAGYAPGGGHLNPYLPQTNITFEQTLDADRPDFVAIQIGLNDILLAGPGCGARCSNVSEFVRIFSESIIAPIQARKIALAIVSVATIGELTNEGNALDGALDDLAAAQLALAYGNGFTFVDVRTADQTYDDTYNCLNVTCGLLTSDGVHPNEPRGVDNLANLQASGVLSALPSPPPDGPLPRPYGGRIFITSQDYALDFGGVAAADAICTNENGGLAAFALIVDAVGCSKRACRRASKTPWLGDEQVDWPLRPDAMYFQLDNVTAVGFTDGHGLFSYPLFFGLPAPDCNATVATGLKVDWTTRSSGTCESWTNVSAPAMVSGGLACRRDPTALSTGNLTSCSASRLMCVTN